MFRQTFTGLSPACHMGGPYWMLMSLIATSKLNAGCLVEGGKLPEDLSLWIDKVSLCLMALEAVHAVEWPASQRFDEAAIASGATSHPVLRSVLVYGLAVGWLSSLEIEQGCREDSIGRYLVSTFAPAEAEIRQYRRDNRELIQRALAQLFAAALARRHQAGVGVGEFSAAARADLKVAAAARLQKAARADSRMLDA